MIPAQVHKPSNSKTKSSQTKKAKKRTAKPSQNITAHLHKPSVTNAPRPKDYICIVGAGPAGDLEPKSDLTLGNQFCRDPHGALPEGQGLFRCCNL